MNFLQRYRDRSVNQSIDIDTLIKNFSEHNWASLICFFIRFLSPTYWGNVNSYRQHELPIS